MRPGRLPDLTKGEVIPPSKTGRIRTWNLGATGIIGVPNAWYDGDQIQVAAVLPGSPADGCRDVLANPEGKDYYRKVAALHQQATILRVDAMPEIARYLGHEHWWLRDEAHQVAVELAKQGGARLVACLRDARKANATGQDAPSSSSSRL